MSVLLDKQDPANKGVKYGKCNRTVCYETALAYNHGTRAYYCVKCACDIQEFTDSCGDSERFTIFEWDDIHKARELQDKIILGEIE